MRKKKEERRKKRHLRIRKKVSGTSAKPRLIVYRSEKHIYASLVNDEEIPCKVLMTVSTLSTEFKKISEEKNVKSWTKEAAKIIGQLIAERAKKEGIEKVVFDRGGYKYTGRVKELADSARKGGLKF